MSRLFDGFLCCTFFSRFVLNTDNFSTDIYLGLPIKLFLYDATSCVKFIMIRDALYVQSNLNFHAMHDDSDTLSHFHFNTSSLHSLAFRLYAQLRNTDDYSQSTEYRTFLIVLETGQTLQNLRHIQFWISVDFNTIAHTI